MPAGTSHRAKDRAAGCSFFLLWYGDHRDLHSFPTRRSSDRPAEIQALPEPERARRPRVESEALRLVPRPENLDRISGHRDRWRDVGQEAAVRPPEPEHAVGLEFDLIAPLVDRAVVPATEEREVGERGRA